MVSSRVTCYCQKLKSIQSFPITMNNIFPYVGLQILLTTSIQQAIYPAWWCSNSFASTIFAPHNQSIYASVFYPNLLPRNSLFHTFHYPPFIHDYTTLAHHIHNFYSSHLFSCCNQTSSLSTTITIFSRTNIQRVIHTHTHHNSTQHHALISCNQNCFNILHQK